LNVLHVILLPSWEYGCRFIYV